MLRVHLLLLLRSMHHPHENDWVWSICTRAWKWLQSLLRNQLTERQYVKILPAAVSYASKNCKHKWWLTPFSDANGGRANWGRNYQPKSFHWWWHQSWYRRPMTLLINLIELSRIRSSSQFVDSSIRQFVNSGWSRQMSESLRDGPDWYGKAN